MAIDPIGGASPRAISAPELHAALAAMPAPLRPPAVQAPVEPAATSVPAPRSRRVELSFHDDLRALMTKVIDEATGDVITQYPDEQVLDVVADVMRRMRQREER